MDNSTTFFTAAQNYTLQFFCMICKMFRNTEHIKFESVLNNDDDMVFTCNVCNDTSINPPLQYA